MGSKKAPLHFLIQHGEMSLPKSSTDFETYSHQELLDWFSSSSGQSEGIVWHSKITNKMFKVWIFIFLYNIIHLYIFIIIIIVYIKS